MSESSAVTYKRDGMVAVITMNKPDRMNRLDTEIVDALHDRWVQFMADDAARVAVVAGAGKAFSAGADLKAVPHHLYHGMPGIGYPVDKPVVAAVQGWCIGGAMVITTMCDIMIVAEDAKFSYPEVKIAFSGGLISNLVTRIPHKIAMELLLVGDTIDAKRAYEVGYANKIVPLDQLMPTALDYARRIAETAPMPSRMLKRFTSETLPKGPTEIAGIARSQVDAINRSADWVEGRAAFAEKRPPKFKGK
jgi:enoyl-CoA hydratase